MLVKNNTSNTNVITRVPIIGTRSYTLKTEDANNRVMIINPDIHEVLSITVDGVMYVNYYTDYYEHGQPKLYEILGGVCFCADLDTAVQIDKLGLSTHFEDITIYYPDLTMPTINGKTPVLIGLYLRTGNNIKISYRQKPSQYDDQYILPWCTTI